jgi:hypothetical protein
MKVTFLHAHNERDYYLGDAIAKGMEGSGDTIVNLDMPAAPQMLDTDFVAFIGLKRRVWFKWCKEHGQRLMYFDKGYYHREFEKRKDFLFWRISVDEQQPTEFISKAKQSPDRWLHLGREMSPWRAKRAKGHIIIANQSEKYHQFYDLPHPTKWVEDIAEELRQYTDRPLWYRPKPSWRNKKKITGLRYCETQPLSELFPGCHALITHASYICVDALLNGIPTITLGPAVTESICSKSLSEIEDPVMASDSERLQIMANLAWCQFTVKEWASGFAWKNVKELFLK